MPPPEHLGAIESVAVRATTPEIEAAISQLGRTEDVRFSPSGLRVALADFNTSQVWVFELAPEPPQARAALTITHLTRLASPDLRYPHGLCWLGETRLVVANREGAVQVFAVAAPTEGPGLQQRVLRAEQTLELGLLEGRASPGSVAQWSPAPGLHELLVCHNYIDRISHHLIGGPDPQGRHWYSAPAILLRQGLDIPDGLALSPDGRWLAISNHGTAEVLIHENLPHLTPDTPPVGVLQGVRYPHGLCFSPDGQSLLVADAGQPLVHVFGADPGGGWFGPRLARTTLQVLTQAVYERERVNATEGGPKGLDIRADGVLVLTCKARPLVFWRLPDNGERPSDPLCRAEHTAGPWPPPGDAFMQRHLKNGLATAEMVKAQNRALVTGIRNSLSWRVTAGLRWLGRLGGMG